MATEVTVLGSDVHLSTYLDTENCMLTRALHRAGLTDWVDNGGQIRNTKTGEIKQPEGYMEVTTKVLGMYATKGQLRTYEHDTKLPLSSPIEDITFTIEI